MYRRVYEVLLSNPWRHPFQYHFVADEDGREYSTPPDGVSGAHFLTLGGQYRFERHTSSPVITTSTRPGSEWVSVAKGGDPRSFAKSAIAARDRGATLDKISPVFWPIASATPQDSLHHFANVRRAVWEAAALPLQQTHPELFIKKVHPPSLAYPMGKTTISAASRALMVMARQQDRTHARFSKGNYHQGVRVWWRYFVDRSILSSLVSVVGGSSIVVIDFAAYAAFTRLPELNQILAGLPSLGESRRALVHAPWSEWTAQGLASHLGPRWTPSNMRHLDNLPRPMRLATAPDMFALGQLEGLDIPGWLNTLHQVARHRLLPRQQAMVTRVMVDLALSSFDSNRDEETFLSFSLNEEESHLRALRVARFQALLSRPDLVDRLVDMAKVWRMAYPESYFRFNNHDRALFMNDARALLLQSPPGRLALVSANQAAQQSRGTLSGDRVDVMLASLTKYNIEKTLPRQGRGRPRKNARPVLGATPVSRPRPAM